MKILGGEGGLGGNGGERGLGRSCGGDTPWSWGGKGGAGAKGSSGVHGTIRVSTRSGDGVIKSDVGFHDIDVLKPPSRECYQLMYTFNTFEFEDGDGVPHSISLNVDDTLSLFDARHLGLAPLPTMLSLTKVDNLRECEGNCEDDDDCADNLKCFKRTSDVSSPVPGCTKGGPMDKPDFNYCYNPLMMKVVDELVYRIEDKCTDRALVSAGSLLGKSYVENHFTLPC